MRDNWTEEELSEVERKRAAEGFVGALAPLVEPTKVNVPKIRQHAERDLEKACSDLLQYDGWRLLKTDPVSDRRRGKGFGELGMADCLYIRYLDGAIIEVPFPGGRTKVHLKPPAAECLWIEWKSPTGKTKAHQRAWHEHERARGALVVVAGEDLMASVEGFLDWYRKSGLMRRPI